MLHDDQSFVMSRTSRLVGSRKDVPGKIDEESREYMKQVNRLADGQWRQEIDVFFTVDFTDASIWAKKICHIPIAFTHILGSAGQTFRDLRIGPTQKLLHGFNGMLDTC
jgi:hypothetical protein